MLLKFLTFIICFELILTPLVSSLGLINQNAYAQNCPTGLNFDSTLNRCLTNEETTQVMNATKNCNGNKDCYMTNASTAFEKKGPPGRKEMNAAGSNLLKGVATAVPVAMAFSLRNLKGNTCAQVSYWLFVGAGAAMIIGDIFINISHHKRLEKIKKEWGSIVAPSGNLDQQREGSVNAQSEAFGKLAESEKSLAKAANSKKIIYYIAAAAYSAAAITAGLELLSPTSYSPCSAVVEPGKPQGIDYTMPPNDITVTPTLISNNNKSNSLFEYYVNSGEKPVFHGRQFYQNIMKSKNFTSLVLNQKAFEKKYSSPSVDEYGLVDRSFNEIKDAASSSSEAFEMFKMISVNVIRELNPLAITYAGDEKSNAAKSFQEDGKKFDQWSWIAPLMGGAVGAAVALWSPQVSAWMTSSLGRTVLGGVMGGLTIWLAGHAATVAKNATSRAEILLKMKEEFKSASNTLYNCKSEDRDDPGKPDCYCYTAENQVNANRGNSLVCQKIMAGANFKLTPLQGVEDRKYCVDKNHNADGSCACKKTGTCLKVGIRNLKGLNVGTMSMLNSSLEPLNSLNNGNTSMANLDPSTLQANAARMVDANKKLLESNAFDKFRDQIAKGESKLKEQLDHISTKSTGGDLLSSTPPRMPTNAQEAARMLEKELAQENSKEVSGNQDTIAAPANKPEEKIPEFDLYKGQDEGQKEQITEMMKDEYDYNENEINDSARTNIFEILSNRYQRSGMKKLFSEDVEDPNTKPSRAEITE